MLQVHTPCTHISLTSSSSVRSNPIIIILVPLRNRTIHIRIRIRLHQQRQNNVIIRQRLSRHCDFSIVRFVQSDGSATGTEILETGGVVPAVAETGFEFVGPAVRVFEVVLFHVVGVLGVAFEVGVVCGAPGGGGGLTCETVFPICSLHCERSEPGIMGHPSRLSLMITHVKVGKSLSSSVAMIMDLDTVAEAVDAFQVKTHLSV